MKFKPLAIAATAFALSACGANCNDPSKSEATPKAEAAEASAPTPVKAAFPNQETVIIPYQKSPEGYHLTPVRITKYEPVPGLHCVTSDKARDTPPFTSCTYIAPKPQ